MTIISLLINKFLTLIGATDLANNSSSSVTLFGFFAIALIACGVLTIARKRPVLSKYDEYTPESVEGASTLLGISDILLGILDIVIGVLKMDQIPVLVLGIASGVVIAAFIAVMTVATKKLVKK